MGRLGKASLISLLFTAYGGSLYYAFAVFSTLSAGGDVVQTFVSTVEGCLLCWVFLTAVMYEVLGVFDELNKPRRHQDPPADENDKGNH
jgi:hypothetical protein